VQRQQEIMQALDLNRNQASNQLSAEEVPIVEEVIQPENVITIENKPRIRMAVA
jgi:ribosomal protein S13